MAKRKNHNIRLVPKQTRAADIRLSQCMIVKNEEKNIERALAWARPYAFEQIVVDTGSTDRTVEIAERLGAKVFHFPWINDFAAAKNFAISKARGNWIAFLDADEYFSSDDAKRVIPLLQALERERSKGAKGDALLTSLANLNDEGKPFNLMQHTRIFRNILNLRYAGAIHEKLEPRDGTMLHVMNARDLTILHTGYSDSAYEETGKRERNIRALLMELEKRPDDIELKAYLGESYFSNGDLDKATPLLREAIYSNDKALPEARLRQAYSYYLRTLNNDMDWKGLEETARLAVNAFSDFPDYQYFLGNALFYQERVEEAYSSYQEAHANLEKNVKQSFLAMNAHLIYNKLIVLAKLLHDTQSTVRYCVLSLRWNPYQHGVTSQLIKLLLEADAQTPPAEMLNFLSKLYDLTKMKDKLLLYKSALSLEDNALAQEIEGLFTEQESAWLKEKDVETLEPGFDALMERLDKTDADALAKAMLRAYEGMQSANMAAMRNGLKLLLHHQAGEESLIQEEFFSRARFMLENKYEIKALYDTLADIRSKNVLLAILLNWADMNIVNLFRVKDRLYTAYFDQDLISFEDNEVFVDVGAYSGDTIYDFLSVCPSYKRIYGYEPTLEMFEQLRQYAAQKSEIAVSRAAVGQAAGKAYLLRDGVDHAFNRVTRTVTDTGVELVSLDEDIRERVTFLKIDAIGMEAEVLEGAKRHIREDCPKLAIKISAQTKDIPALVRRIEELNSDYRFYLRYYGGNLIPSEIVLYGKAEVRG